MNPSRLLPRLTLILVGLTIVSQLAVTGCQVTGPRRDPERPANEDSSTHHGVRPPGHSERPGAQTWRQIEPPDFVAAGLTLEEASAARNLGVLKCGRCHEFYDPQGYSESEWSHWMEKMARKARLKENQTRLLTQYLNGIRTRP